jgi:glutamyl-tRNA synthetase
VLEYRDHGYVPDAVVNFLALLGWSLDDKTDIIDRETLVTHFDVARLLPNPAVFNAEKLLWMNGVYIRQMSPEELAEAVRPYLEDSLGKAVDSGTLRRIVPLVQERIKVLTEIVEMANFFFVDEPPEIETDTLLGKKLAAQPEVAREALRRVIEATEPISEWTHEALEAAIRPLADGLGLKAGDLFGVVRVAVTGKTATPPLFETMEILGREKTLERLNAAIAKVAA